MSGPSTVRPGRPTGAGGPLRAGAPAPGPAAAPLVSLTLLALPPRDPLAQAVFWVHTLRSRAQLGRAPGRLADRLWLGPDGYHTATLWRSEADLYAYFTSGAHRRAMRAFGWLRRRGARAASLRYLHPDPARPALPARAEAEARLAEAAR